MTPSKPAFRSRLQQQPQRVMDRQQQQSSGSREFQPRAFGASRPPLPDGQMGGKDGSRAGMG